MRKSVFIERTSANAKLAEIVLNPGLVMLSAGSATGKTTTMSKFLSKTFKSPATGEDVVPAVCHLKLRTVSTPAKATAAFRNALDLTGEMGRKAILLSAYLTISIYLRQIFDIGRPFL